MTDKSSSPPLDQRLLSILVCPLTKGSLVYDREKNELISCEAALAYPVKEGIPVMIVEEARQLTDEEVNLYKQNLIKMMHVASLNA